MTLQFSSDDSDYRNFLSWVKADVADAEEWFRANQLLINCDKTQNVLISLRERPNSCTDPQLSSKVNPSGFLAILYLSGSGFSQGGARKCSCTPLAKIKK